jgi:RNA polymerase sigma factor for flagellar operon FliA
MPSPRGLELYRQHASDSIEARVNEYMPLVKRLAYHLIARLPANVEVGDLIQAGLIGLMDAARNFDDDAGVQFETYASQRIRGAMLDELRDADWLPRHLRKSMRALETAISRLEHRFGRNPTDSEVASELQMSLAEYQTLLADCRGHQLIYYDEFDDDGHGDLREQLAADASANPAEALSDADFRTALITAIEALPERERLVMALYYDEEMNLKEIGAVLGVTESRVSQLHSQAVARLRGKLRDWTQS